MTNREVELLAVGAGPSNLGLAVALEELAPDLADNALIIDRNPTIEWQSGLLLPWAKSQVSFLKDLVTLRNPRSRFSFLNFLKSTDRLDAFINLGNQSPYRLEISAYLNWVADSLTRVKLELGQDCVAIAPSRSSSGALTGWVASMADGSTITSRYLVIATGRDPNIPPALAGLPSDRVIHSTRYRPAIAGLQKQLPYRLALIGSSQSAAEVFRALRSDLPDSDVAWLMRSIGPTADPSSKFTNELYYPSYVDEFFDTPADGRVLIRQELYKTNYSCMTPAMLQSLYTDFYRDRLDRRHDRRLITLTEVTAAREEDGEVVLELTDRRTGSITELRRDMVFLGTGFNWQPPKLIQGLADAIGLKKIDVTRGYRLVVDEPAEAACYLQGINEATHGIGDSLLSVLAHRAKDITFDVLAHRAAGRSDNGASPAGHSADILNQIAGR
ncbi:MAG TPA: SidA/IucD/PvdA family monooxygenase [Jatrophihabitans sp.]|jgi:L-ornithine N5-oxygenase|uniref:SidA/IucD/PvdA family monooxygenase n=1 Tax=Jatrophihabitans sp. TaxID=1932789 RepID=UPI002F1F77CC